MVIGRSLKTTWLTSLRTKHLFWDQSALIGYEGVCVGTSISIQGVVVAMLSRFMRQACKLLRCNCSLYYSISK